MMMEPYDKIIDPLINNMSSEEEQYFSIPGHEKFQILKNFRKKYQSIIKIDLKKETALLIFGLYQKIRKNLELLIDMKNKALN